MISDAHLLCGICLESVLETDCVHMCCDKTHNGMCKGCTSSYISNKIESAFLGSCPTIYCPCLHADSKRRRTLDFKQWKLLISENVAKEYTLLADSLLAFLCGGCHSLKSLQIISTDEQVNQAHCHLKKAIDAIGVPVSFEMFLLELNQYQAGEMTVEEFYNRICTVYFSGSMVSNHPKVEISNPFMIDILHCSRESLHHNINQIFLHLWHQITATDKDVWEEFKRILRMIMDPERRANLHLRHLRSRPRIWTPCCHREHCFRCKTKVSIHKNNMIYGNTALPRFSKMIY